MKKKYGFTLIELLAVIVVLAVIAMITTPIVFGIIKTAKKGSAEQSTVAYAKAVEDTVAIEAMNNRSYANRDDYLYDEIKVDVSGSTPTGGLYALKDGIVTRGIFCVNGYKVTYSDSQAKAYENCTGDDLKWDSSLKLEQSSGFYVYPESKQINIVENTSGGKISCTSSDEKVATCSVTGTTIKIASGTKEGVSTITVKSEGNSKYKDAYAAYVATTQKGLISYTSNGYEGVYDGNLHGITVIANGYKVKYGETEGTYNLDESPKYVDVGEYKVYYQISKDGYAEVKGSKDVIISQAKGNIVLEETKGNLEYNKIKKVQIKENKANNSLIVSVEDENIAQARIENNELIITGKKVGTTKITLSSSETKNYSSASTEYIVTIIKASNKIVLSSTNGTYTYPNSGTFNIASNPSGGKLSCTTSNKNVAECTISGNTVTVKPGTTKGSATLTITSEATTNYNAGKAVYVAITEPGALSSYTANGYEGAYDGNPHGITVTSSGSTITYSTDGTNYSSTNPTLTNVGEMVVYYKISKPGYSTVQGSKKIVITKATGKVTPPTAKTLKYTGNAQELVNAGSSTTGQIQYKIGKTGTYSTKIPTGTDVGTYTVYYKVVGDSNHNDVAERSLNVTINPNILEYESNGYEGVYDGNSHGITVTSSGSTITYSTDGTNYSSTSPKYTNAGVYTVYYRITRKGYVTVENSENIKITKANNILKLSSNSGTYTYPNSGTFSITSNTSGGKLSCTTSNKNVAECTISGNTVTVKPGTTKGSATLTITSEATTNYNAGKAVYAVTAEQGKLSYTANGYEGTYNGNSHGITVTSSGATITYSTDGKNYSSTSPKYTNAGIYTVYYKIEKLGYNTITGNKQVIIIPSAPTITASDSIGSGSWHTSKYTLTFSSSGASSSVYYYYGTSSNPSTKGSSVVISSDTGKTTYYVKACVSDSKCSAVSSYSAKLDSTKPNKPSFEIKLGSRTGSNYINDSWTNNNGYFIVKSSDDTSGIDHYEVSVSGGEWITVNESIGWNYEISDDHKTMYAMINWDGNWTFKFRAVDYAGNKSDESATIRFKRDTKSPSFGTVSFNPNLTSWANRCGKKINASWNLTDSGGSGLKMQNGHPYLMRAYYSTKSKNTLLSPVYGYDSDATTRGNIYGGGGILKVCAYDNAGNSTCFEKTLYQYCSSEDPWSLTYVTA